MQSYRWLIISFLITGLTACNQPGPANSPTNDPVVSQAEAAASVAYAAAIVGHRNLADTNRYPSDGSNPNPPTPTPTPTPSGVCDLCDGKNWIGDGQPRNPCPKCNAEGKKPPRGFTHIGNAPEPQPNWPTAFPKLDASLSKIIAADSPFDKAGVADQLEAEAPIMDEAEGDVEPTLPTESPSASPPDLEADPPAPAPEPVPEPPKAEVVIYRAAADAVLVDIWLRDAWPQWEKLGWVKQLQEAPSKIKKSYFIVREPNGTVTSVYEYLNKESLARARLQKSAR